MAYKQMNAHERDLLKGSSSQGRLCRSLNDLMSNVLKSHRTGKQWRYPTRGIYSVVLAGFPDAVKSCFSDFCHALPRQVVIS